LTGIALAPVNHDYQTPFKNVIEQNRLYAILCVDGGETVVVQLEQFFYR
jgi:hypothetical protein